MHARRRISGVDRGTVTVNGLLGWAAIGDRAGLTPHIMAERGTTPSDSAFASHTGPGFAVAADGAVGTSCIISNNGLVAALHGHPFWRDGKQRFATCANVVPRL